MSINALFVKAGEIIGYTILGINIWRLIFAVLVFTAVMLSRKFFRNFFVGIVRTLSVRIKIVLDDKIVEILNPPFELLFLAIGIWLSFYILGAEKVFSIISTVERTLLIFIVSWVIYSTLNVIVYLLKKISERSDTKLDNYLIVFVGNVMKTIVIILGLLMALQELGYNVTTIITGLGIGGLAFALASKDFVSNIFGFLTIFLDKPFTVGDWIVTPDVEGTVEDIWLRCTKIRTFDQSLVTIPNAVIATKLVSNKSKMGKRRITFKLGILCSSSGEQIDKLCTKLREMLTNQPGINKETILVYFTDFDESSFNLFLYFFTDTTVWKEYLEVQHDVNIKIMNILKDSGMGLAYPSRSIYLENFDTQSQKILDELVFKKLVKQM